jgi:hypothetical protein
MKPEFAIYNFKLVVLSYVIYSVIKWCLVIILLFMVKIIPCNCLSISKSFASGWLDSEHDHNGLLDGAGLRCYDFMLCLRLCIILTSLICFLIMLYFSWTGLIPCSGAMIIAARRSLIRFADSSRFCSLYGCDCD